MSITDLLTSQLIDPFRIGMLFFLLLTTRRTAAQTGNFLPVVFGALFVAVLIPNSLGAAATDDKWTAVGVGLISNAIIIAVLLALWSAYQRITQR